MIAAYMLIQDKVGQAATVAAAVRGVAGAASVAGPSGVIALGTGTRHRRVGQAGALPGAGSGGVLPAMSCPVVHR
jgi:hypothetical protein